MRPPFSPFQLLLLLFVLALTIIVIYLGVFALALEKLGLSAHSAMLLLICMLLGSGINLPLFTIDAEAPLAQGADPRFVRRAASRTCAEAHAVTRVAGSWRVPASTQTGAAPAEWKDDDRVDRRRVGRSYGRR